MAGRAHTAHSTGSRGSGASVPDRPFSALDAMSTRGSEVVSHRPPVYDSLGRELKHGKGWGLGIRKHDQHHTATGKPTVPAKWEKKPPHATIEAMKNTRKREYRPHWTFDLDGDGTVSKKDFFFAQQFDADGDGKLNSKERSAALAAMAAGYDKRFHEVVGGPAHFADHRTIQRRGMVVTEESGNWGELSKTYHARQLAPASHYAPYAPEGPGGAAAGAMGDTIRTKAADRGLGTKSKLMLVRKRENVRDLSRKAGDVVTSGAVDDSASVSSLNLTKPYTHSDTLKASATHKSELLRHRKKAELRSILEKSGMPEAIEHIPDTVRTDATVDGRAIGQEKLSRTRKQLIRRRKREHKSGAWKAAPTKPLGVHDKPLRSFHENNTEKGEVWWNDKSRTEGVEPTSWAGSDLDGAVKPRAIPKSGIISKNGRRVDAKTGQPLVKSGLQWIAEGEPATDTLRRRELPTVETSAWKRKHAEPALKTTQVSHWDPAKLGNKQAHRTVTRRRWTDVQIEYRQAMEESDAPDALLDENGKSIFVDRKEYAPLYSSFANDGVFRPSPHVGAVVPKHRIPQVARPTSPGGRSKTSFSLMSMGAETYGVGHAVPEEPGAVPSKDEGIYGVPSIAEHDFTMSPSARLRLSKSEGFLGSGRGGPSRAHTHAGILQEELSMSLSKSLSKSVPLRRRMRTTASVGELGVRTGGFAQLA